MKKIIFDLEADSLTPNYIHCVSYQSDLENTIHTIDSHTKWKETTQEPHYLIGHNIIRYDIPALEKVWGYKPVEGTVLVDTLALSWYLEPLRVKHGLEEWGEFFGYPKVQIDDWENLPQEEYIKRCERDVEITKMLWDYLWGKLIVLYEDPNQALNFIKYTSFKLECARMAEENKWQLDVELTKKNLEILQQLKDQKLHVLKQGMPPKDVIKKFNRPKVYFKADGTKSLAAQRWEHEAEFLGLESLDEVNWFDKKVGEIEANPSAPMQIKEWLFDLGWKPCTFKQNKKKEDIPQINGKDGVTPSVFHLIDKNPAVEALDSLGKLTHRIGLLKGFLRNEHNGYLKAEVAGFTNTLRFKHAGIVNLPSVDLPFGEFIRPCLIAPKGYELVGSDMSSLEDRTKQHYMFKYDPEYVKEMNTEGFDPHLDIAVEAGMMSDKDAQDYKDGVNHKALHPIRHAAKTTNYSCTYGAYPPKIAKAANLPIEEAETLWEGYWKRNWSINKIAEACTVKKIGDQMWLLNPVNNFWYSLRSEKDRFSTLNQGTGSYCFDVWLGFVIQSRQFIIGQFHDEFIGIVEKREGQQHEVEKVLNEAINETNNFLKLNRPLGIDIKFGSNYGQIH